MSKTDELISKLEDSLEIIKEYNQSMTVVSWGYEEGVLITGEDAEYIISQLKEQIKKEEIKEKIKSHTSNAEPVVSRWIREDELIESIESIFENTKRIHGKSESIDWIKIAIHKSVEFILKSEAEKPKDNYGRDKGIKLEIEAQKQVKVFDFVVRHKIDCYNAFKLSIAHEGYKKPEGQKLIKLARKEIGYSVKTWSGDIYSSLYNTYKSIVVDGKNEPTVNSSIQPDLDCGIYEEKQIMKNDIEKQITEILNKNLFVNYGANLINNEDSVGGKLKSIKEIASLFEDMYSAEFVEWFKFQTDWIKIVMDGKECYISAHFLGSNEPPKEYSLRDIYKLWK